MNIKQEVVTELHAILKVNYLMMREDIFKKYPKAMMFLGLAPSNYYKEVNKTELDNNIDVPKGIYPIECGQGLNGVKEDRLTYDKLNNLIKDVLKQQLPDLDPEDVDDVINGNDDRMAGSTNSAWTNQYDYLY